MNITSIIESAPVELPQNNVFCLPSNLTHLQKCLIDVLLTLHKPQLMRMVEANESTEEDSNLTNTEMLSLLAHNWQNIISHPFLLVDHYIPKNLILMESSPNLIKDSGKFKQFDNLINKLENFNYNIIVVAKSIKEIDLIESYLLGRRLNYKRYTGASLYDMNTYQESSFTKMATSNSSSTKRKKTDDYIPRRSQNDPQVQYLLKNPKDKLAVHLISSNLIKTVHFNDNLKFNFIISFDPLLSELIYLRQLKSVDNNLIPVIKLVVFNSIEHSKLIGETDFSKSVLDTVVNKDEDYEVEVSSEWLKDYKKIQWPLELGDLKKKYDKDGMLNILNNNIGQMNNKKIKLEDGIKPSMSLGEYKQNFTRLIKDKIDEISGNIILKNEELNPIRCKESQVQVEIESKNGKIAEFVKLKQSLEVELNALTKRVEKLDSDLGKLDVIKNSKNEILESEIKDNIEIDERELEDLNQLNEQIRLEYQDTSSKALESSMKLTIITNENTKIKAKLDDTVQKIISEQLEKTNSAKQQHKIDKLNRQNEFLVNYNNKINNIIRNNNIVDSNNSRNINGRLSRSTTPRI